MIGAIVLAAGESTRMGTQKLLLPYAGSTVIGHIVDRLIESDAGEIVVVTGHEPGRIRTALADRNAALVQNDRYREGMLSSVRTGFAEASDSWDGALVVLGDQPSIQTATVNRLVEESRECPVGLIVPVYEDRRGHPILIPMKYRSEILEQYDTVGLRGLIRAHPEVIVEVALNTGSVLEDMDYPEDYERALKLLEEANE